MKENSIDNNEEVVLLKKRIKKFESLIRENKQTEEELRARIHTFQDLYENSPNMYISVDVKTGKIIHCNNTTAKETQYTKEEIVGMSVFDMYHPDCIEEVEKTFEVFKRTGEVKNKELQLKRKDGSKIEVLLDVTSVRNKNGDILYSRSSWRDIAKLKRSEEIIEKTSRQWQSTFNAVNDSISVIDLDGNILRCNSAMCKLVNKPREKIINRKCWEIVHGTNEPIEDCPIVHMKSTHKRESMVFKQNGSWLEVIVDPILNINQELVGAVHIIYDITERKKAEEELLISHQQMVNTLESMGDAFVSLDNNWNYTYMNKNAGEIFNCDPQEMIGKHIWTEFPEGVGQPFYKNYYKAMETQKPIYMEDYYTPYDRWFENRIYPSKFGLSIFFQDITERKKTEEMLKKQNYRIEQILQTTQNGYILADTDGVIKDVNPAYCEMMGYTRKELLKMNIRDLEVQLSHKEIERRIKQMVEKGKDRFESKHKRKNGFIIDLDVSIVIIKSDGSPLVAAFVNDITDHKKAIDSLKKRSNELTTLNVLGRQVSSNLSLNQVAKAAIEGITEAVHPELALLFLRKEDKLILQGFGPQKSKYAHDSTPVHCVGECLCGLAVKDKMSIYVNDIRKDSRCTWKECKKAGLKSFAALPLLSGDDVIGVMGLASSELREFKMQSEFIETISNEVSISLQNAILYEKIQSHAIELEQTVAERTNELKETVLHLQDLDKLKSIFLASMSHELRTPLNSIIGFTGILLMGMAGVLNEEQKTQLKKVKNNADHLLSLINDILDISKIEAGKVDVYIEKINLKNIVKDVIDTVSPMAKEKNLEIHYSIPKSIVLASDERRLKQVLMNLVSNAVKYTDKGSINIKVRALKNKTIKINIVDTGIGISKKNLEKLFQPFQQIDTSLTKKQAGTGLGLYLCKKLLNLLGGSISVNSEYRKGSEFSFILPLKYKEKN